MPVWTDPSTNTPPPGGARPRVLVVDDEPVVRAVARLMLERAGFAVEEAGGAGEALERVRSAPAPFAAVLLDHTLHDRSGADVLPELRRLAPGLRVVLTSGRAEEELPGHGADAYLPKPFTREQLVAAVGALATNG
jgi:two-component system cell cycle response regulator CtrA